MGRNLRPWWIALVISLLLHALLIAGMRADLPRWVLPDDPPVYDVRLVPARPAVELPAARPVAAPSPPPPSSSTHAPTPPVPEAAEVALPVDPADAADEPALPPVVVPPEVASLDPASPPSPAAREPDARPAPAPETPTPAAPAAPPGPAPLNALPPRIDMRFKLSYGIASGEQTLVWVDEGDARYTAISVAEATGLAGLFYRGRFVQTSRGRITPSGLQPEEFWDQRGDKRSSGHFDHDAGRLTLNPAKGAPRHFEFSGPVQDALSLFFQIALTAPPGANELAYTVFNGKKIRDYRYEVRELSRLETAIGPLRTLHLARVTDGDGRFEVWLAVDRHYLPVRIVKSDDKDNAIELTLMSMTP